MKWQPTGHPGEMMRAGKAPAFGRAHVSWIDLERGWATVQAGGWLLGAPTFTTHERRGGSWWHGQQPAAPKVAALLEQAWRSLGGPWSPAVEALEKLASITSAFGADVDNLLNSAMPDGAEEEDAGEVD